MGCRIRLAHDHSGLAYGYGWAQFTRYFNHYAMDSKEKEPCSVVFLMDLLVSAGTSLEALI